MKQVTNIHPVRSVYVIHVINNDLSMKDIYCHSQDMLNKRVTELCDDKSVHDFTIWQKIDFDLEEK